MKVLKKIIIISILLTVNFACSNEYLVENPPHILAADNLYVNLSGFESGINSLYAQFREERNGVSWGNDLTIDPALCGTDNCYGCTVSGWNRVGNDWGTYNTSTHGQYKYMWSWLYGIINSANTIIARAENPNIDWTEEQKNTTLAVARHFRAWSYRHLTFLWGDVPLNLEESSGSNIVINWERTPMADVRKQMEEDWLFSEQYLPDVQTNNGNISKAVVQHYLAELYLTIGDPAKAKSKAEAVISNPNYKLVTTRYGVKANKPGTPFSDMFIDGNSNRSEGNTETLWTIQCEKEVIGGGRSIMRKWTRNRLFSGFKVGGKANTVLFTVEMGGRGVGRILPTRFAMELYGPGDDRGGIHSWWTYAIMNNPESLPSGMALGDTAWLAWKGRNEKLEDYYWPSTSKWDYADPDFLTDAFNYNDLIYLRLADTYLLFAEAQLKLGDAAGAAQTINVIRRRARASEITAGDVNIDFILDERSRELYSEEHRRYTLLRTDKWFERTKLYNKIASSKITERDKLFPIPQSVIDANLTIPMRQNPDY